MRQNKLTGSVICEKMAAFAKGGSNRQIRRIFPAAGILAKQLLGVDL